MKPILCFFHKMKLIDSRKDDKSKHFKSVICSIKSKRLKESFRLNLIKHNLTTDNIRLVKTLK